jgi:hypothetical protein
MRRSGQLKAPRWWLSAAASGLRLPTAIFSCGRRAKRTGVDDTASVLHPCVDTETAWGQVPYEDLRNVGLAVADCPT